MPAMSGPRGPWLSLNCPDTTMPTTLATRNPVNAQPKPPRPCRSRAAVGSATDTAMASKATSVIRIRMPTLVVRSRPAKIERGTSGSSGRFAWTVTFAIIPDPLKAGQPPADQALRFLISSASCGATVNRSPTTP